MNSLAHDQARELIQEGRLPESDRIALRHHLALCPQCRGYAAVHAQLQRQVPAINARLKPTHTQRETIMAVVDRGQAVPRYWRPLMAMSGLATVVFLATAFWLMLSAIRPMTNRPISSTTIETAAVPALPLPASVVPAVTLSPPPPATPDPRGRFVMITVPAPSLAGNLIGEPGEQQVLVYLPPSYDSSNRRYPVVYGLITRTSVSARRASDDTATQTGTAIQTAMKIALDTGTPEMIVVVPDVLNSLGLTNYFVDSPVTGNWQRFVARDLVSYIDTHYRTLPSPESRGIIGEYEHGLGALLLAARYPDVYSAVSLVHPVIYYPGYSVYEDLLQSKVGRSLMLDLRADAATLPADAGATWLFDRYPEDEYIPFALAEAMAYGMSFAPNVEAAPLFFDYPYSDTDENLDTAILERWENGLGNIEDQLSQHAGELHGLHITIDYYDNIALFDSAGVLYLSDRLTDLGIEHTTRPSGLYQPSTMGILGTEVFPTFAKTLAQD